MIKMDVAIINLGTGNLYSLYDATRKVATSDRIVVTRNPDTILRSDRIIIPGQGNSAESISMLSKNVQLKEVIFQSIKLKPALSICMGQHILCQSSAEGSAKCLDLFSGSVKRLKEGRSIPNIGWRSVFTNRRHQMFSNIPFLSEFYFSHSYFIEPDQQHTVAITLYGGNVLSSVMVKDNVLATQFHPEKSSYYGSIMLFNFLRWKP